MIAFLGCVLGLAVLTPCLLVRWAASYADQREREGGWRR